MEVDTFDIKTILSFERRYVIPTFQRDYEWTRDGQWELLFDDLETVASRLAGAREPAVISGEALTKAEKRVAPHFLGAIVIDGLPHSPGSLDLCSVIARIARAPAHQEPRGRRARSRRDLQAVAATRDRDVWRLAMKWTS